MLELRRRREIRLKQNASRKYSGRGRPGAEPWILFNRAKKKTSSSSAEGNTSRIPIGRTCNEYNVVGMFRVLGLVFTLRGKTRVDHVRNVWKQAHLTYPMAEFLRDKRLIWFGHVQRRDKDEATRKILQMAVDGKRNRGRPKLRWRDLVKDDMVRNQMTTEMAEDRKHWHVMIQAGVTVCACMRFACVIRSG